MKLETTGGGTFSSKDLKSNGRTVLYFYPRDNTPGCTKEGQEFAACFKKFNKLGVRIFGVSGDSLASHEKFSTKFSFPFALISDPDWELCQKFGVIKIKSLYGKKYEGIERSTFVLGPTGKIEKEWRGLKVPGHVDEVLEYLEQA
jgi:peroxiredoxin Q/BCP